MFTAEMIAPYGLDCSIYRRALVKVDPCPGYNGPDDHKPEFCAKLPGAESTSFTSMGSLVWLQDRPL